MVAFGKLFYLIYISEEPYSSTAQTMGQIMLRKSSKLAIFDLNTEFRSKLRIEG